MYKSQLLFKGHQTTATERSFFTTNTGYMGLGPAYTEIGDVVCAIPPVNVPFILRPKGNRYQLVGESFVLGIMDGEAIQEYRQGRLKMEEFEII